MNEQIDSRYDSPVVIPLVLHFDGEVPTEGLDADEVAAVADGMAKAVQFLVNRAGQPGHTHVLHLTEVHPGSATFKFLLEIAGIVQSVLPVFTGGSISIKDVGEILAQSVKVLEFLDKKPPQSVSTTQIDGQANVSLVNSAGAQISISAPTYNIIKNVYYQEQIGKATKPLRKKKRTLAIKEGKRTLHNTSSDKYPAITARPMNDNQPLTTNVIEATLRVRQPHLDGDDSWRFSWGRNVITAKLADRAFMDKVRSGEEEFRAGDVLRVKLRIEEEQKGKNVTKRHYIDEVMLRERRA